MPHAISSGSQETSHCYCVLGCYPCMQNGCLGLFSIISHRSSCFWEGWRKEGDEVKKDQGAVWPFQTCRGWLWRELIEHYTLLRQTKVFEIYAWGFYLQLQLEKSGFCAACFNSPEDKIRLSVLLQEGEQAVRSTCIILKDAERHFSLIMCPRGHYCIMTLSATALHGWISSNRRSCFWSVADCSLFPELFLIPGGRKPSFSLLLQFCKTVHKCFPVSFMAILCIIYPSRKS